MGLKITQWNGKFRISMDNEVLEFKTVKEFKKELDYLIKLKDDYKLK